jgi:hypothetical protein
MICFGERDESGSERDKFRPSTLNQTAAGTVELAGWGQALDCMVAHWAGVLFFSVMAWITCRNEERKGENWKGDNSGEGGEGKQ